MGRHLNLRRWAPERSLSWLPGAVVLVADQPHARIDGADRRRAHTDELDALGLPVGAEVIWRANFLLGATSGELWGEGLATYPAPPEGSEEEQLLLSPTPIEIGDVERALGRSVTARDERVEVCDGPEPDLAPALAGHQLARLVRTSRDDAGPFGRFVFTYRRDRLRLAGASR